MKCVQIILKEVIPINIPNRTLVSGVWVWSLMLMEWGLMEHLLHADTLAPHKQKHVFTVLLFIREKLDKWFF